MLPCALGARQKWSGWAAAVVRFCTTIAQQELLFGPVFAKFCNAGQVGRVASRGSGSGELCTQLNGSRLCVACRALQSCAPRVAPLLSCCATARRSRCTLHASPPGWAACGAHTRRRGAESRCRCGRGATSPGADVGARWQGGIFLELLEPYILTDRLTRLNPAIMQVRYAAHAPCSRNRRVPQARVSLSMVSH